MTTLKKRLKKLLVGGTLLISIAPASLPDRTALAAPPEVTTAPQPQVSRQNPYIWADVPDNSMIRVGDTYYMSSTTMHMNPGLPIMKSRDLVNWQLINYAYDTLGDSDALALRNGKQEYSRGSWASSLRYHKGAFYVSTFSLTTGRTYIYTTRDIEKGPWKTVSFAPAMHDHSLFFDDDGRIYMVTGSGNLRLVELNDDLSGVKPDGFNQVIIPNATQVAGPNPGLPAEGSQLFKVNGKYYLFSITWPKGGMRTELVFRADTITGPYEGKIAFSDRGVAQGGIIDAPDGKWYAYLFQDHGAVGRTPFLVPMTWKDAWPVIGAEGKLPAELNLPAGHGLIPGIVASDDFDRPESLLSDLNKTPRGENDFVRSAFPLVWQSNHNPDNRYWSLSDRPGWLRLTTGRVDTDLTEARNTLTQRMFGPECSGSIALDVSQMKDGDVAGLAAFQKNYGFVGIRRTGDSESIVMVSAQSGAPIEVQSLPLHQNSVFLRVDGDFRNRSDIAHFFYSLDGKNWTPIGEPLKMSYTLPHFMGYRFALFNFATKTAGGFADFDYFHVTGARDTGAESGTRTTAGPPGAALVPDSATTALPRGDENSRIAHRQMVAKAKTGKIDVYFLGDSITRRWGCSDPQWAPMLANWKHNFYGWNAANFGWGADSIQNILWRVQNGEMEGVHPKVIVILAGTNNIGNRPASSEARSSAKVVDIVAGMRSLVATCREKAPDAKIILTAIFPRNDNLAVLPEINRVNDGIARLADGKSIYYINVNDKLADAAGKLLDGVTVDSLHLTVKGYQIWADGLRPLLTTFLGAPAKTDDAPPPTGDPSATRPAKGS